MTDPSIRSMTADDRPAVLELLRSTMGWDEDERTDRFFAWKHDLSPFGSSPGWVGLGDDGEIVAVRILLPWRFASPTATVDAVRAVDTATHPSQQGRGWFTRLTLAAIASLTTDRVGFVFNTPNDRSRPGYLKMGWVDAGRPVLGLRTNSLGAVTRVLRSRVPASKWADPVGSAPRALEVLDDTAAVTSLLEDRQTDGFETARSPEYLRWRYGLDDLGYQAVSLGSDVSEGMAIYRVRRRGQMTEASVCELLAPRGDRRALRGLVSAVLADSGADVAITAGATPGTIPVAGIGPRVTTRVVAAAPVAPRWQLGDLELF